MPDIRIYQQGPMVSWGGVTTALPPDLVYEGPGVDHATDCPGPNETYKSLGERPDGRDAGVVECPHCGASRPAVDGRPLEGTRGPEPDEPVPAPRRAGRPAWDAETFRERYREAVASTARPQTPTRIAASFRRLDDTQGIEPDSLARLLRRFPTLIDPE